MIRNWNEGSEESNCIHSNNEKRKVRQVIIKEKILQKFLLVSGTKSKIKTPNKGVNEVSIRGLKVSIYNVF